MNQKTNGLKQVIRSSGVPPNDMVEESQSKFDDLNRSNVC